MTMIISSQPDHDKTKNELFVKCRQCPYKSHVSTEQSMTVLHPIIRHLSEVKYRTKEKENTVQQNKYKKHSVPLK